MSAQSKTACMVDKGKMLESTPCQSQGNRMVVIDNKAYGVCDEDWEWANRIRQLHIKTK